jgi:hypothetical protein
MKLVKEKEGRRYYLLAIDGQSDINFSGWNAPFSCGLWNNRLLVPFEEKIAIVQKLVLLGCMSLMAGGPEHFIWHQTADEAYGRMNFTKEEYDKRFLFTGGIGESTMEEFITDIFYNAFASVESGLDEYSYFLVLLLGKDDKLLQDLEENIKLALS